ncbi:MAG TPA: GGDEF domain-containing protein [Burkholderiaceae bacterium]|nr:GGDEF domain-containing protein [Burkholderiaceae bacterium]
MARLLLGAAALVLCATASAVPAGDAASAPPARVAAYRADAFGTLVDTLIYDGYERPAQALAALAALQPAHAGSVRERAMLLFAIGSIEAQSGGTVHAGAMAEQLAALSPAGAGGRELAASNLIRALVAENAGQLDVAAALAQSALPALLTGCPGAPAAPEGQVCALPLAWRALQILERRAFSQGLPAIAAGHAQTGLTLAEWAGDARRRAENLSALAMLANGRGEREAAQRLIAQARRLALQSDDQAAQARVANAEARVANAQGERETALRCYEEALALAALAQAPRLEARLLSNISDTYTRLGRPADALRAADRALVIVRRHHDESAERLLINNAGIAKIGLGRIAEGKRDLARLLELWQRNGETGWQVGTLREFGEALAAAGDARGALELYHRERALSAELMRTNRAIALKELQSRNDAEARQRDIELLARDNALKTEALSNRDLQQRIWALLAAVMLLAIVLVAILYRRVRETHARLAASHLQLQAQSERDPLTNLANRRHFQAVMTGLGRDGGFEGALLLVDIDHFKHVNDSHGHACGDQVLIEVANRLNEAVRSDDLVVRWGGEEFLILVPRAGPEQAEQMAARVLRVIGQAPIAAGATPEARALRVTASIGYARFPLPPYGHPVPWEQAINLADMALYTAKNQGRNRAVGITSSTASTPQALRDLESDFDRAWHEGRVTLLQTAGPEPRGELVRAA